LALLEVPFGGDVNADRSSGVVLICYALMCACVPAVWGLGAAVPTVIVVFFGLLTLVLAGVLLLADPKVKRALAERLPFF
jgi:hypothetical protein